MTEFLWIAGMGGAAFGGALAVPLLRKPSESARLAGVSAGVLALVVALIAGRHGGLLPSLADRLAENLVNLLAVVAAPLFMGWVGQQVGRGPSARTVARWLPVPIAFYLVSAISLENGRVPFAWILPIVTISNLCALGLWRQRPRPALSATPDWLGRAIAFALAINIAQAIRTLWPDVLWLREIVPFTIAGGFLVAASIAVSRAVQDPRYARSSLHEGVARDLLTRLDERMTSERWFLDPALSLAMLSRRLEVTPHVLSEALNRVRNTSLPDYLISRRVEEARRRLADPECDRFTIDGIAADSGFKSRSAFYKSFSAVTGMTPTEFRKEARRR